MHGLGCKTDHNQVARRNARYLQTRIQFNGIAERNQSQWSTESNASCVSTRAHNLSKGSYIFQPIFLLNIHETVTRILHTLTDLAHTIFLFELSGEVLRFTLTMSAFYRCM